MASFSRDYLKEVLFIYVTLLLSDCHGNDILGCGGFVKSHVTLDYSKIEIGLYTKSGTLKEKTECAPTNGYYFLPIYEKGDYIVKVHPPAGWSFEPPNVELLVDGVTDVCSIGQDINFVFNGFGIAGRVLTLGQRAGPSGVSVQLVNDKGEIRNTVTTVGGDFHFTPVIPGKYIVKASHPRWKLDPSQAVVQVKEGNTALPVGVLAVKGYDVKGSVTSFGSPISGLTVLLYSKEEHLKYRIEGCNTALLQGVPDSPVCHVITDTAGEFSFGMVPAGEYILLPLAQPPGQNAVTFNVKPESVPFSVQHDSLYIRNAFEVTGFAVVSTVLSSIGGTGIKGVQVILDGKPVAKTDAAGKYTLPGLQPGTYTVTFKHEECEIEPSSVSVSARGAVRVSATSVRAWRVCGAVRPRAERRVRIVADTATAPARTVSTTEADAGKWCTFLPPGTYTANVEVSEQEAKDGLQFYPFSQQILVGKGPVEGVTFSQLKARVTGVVQCLSRCDEMAVTLTQLGQQESDSDAQGKQLTVVAKDGKYTFENVLPGSVEVSVPMDKLCWQQARHVVTVTQEHVAVTPFRQTGYVLRFHVSHAVEVAYNSSGGVAGVLSVAAGGSAQCVRGVGEYRLTPRGCHRFQPPHTTVTVTNTNSVVNTVYFVAVAHAVTVRITSAQHVDDLMLNVDSSEGVHDVGPLMGVKEGEEYIYEHTLYMPDGEVAVVSGSSNRVLVSPRGPQQVVGRGHCQRAALQLRVVPARVLAGRLRPTVPGVALTLADHDGEVITKYVTTEDGTYRFGPLDASKQYTVTAEKESYVFTAPDENGDIVAHKLAEIVVELVDEADGTPLQGGVVSVSGGSYRRNLAGGGAGGAGGVLRFSSLAPDTYYVKPLMKEYRFDPAHVIVPLQQGETHRLTLRGVRVAWSCVGRVVSLARRGHARVVLLAEPRARADRSPAPAEEATSDDNGEFRIRGLLPGYEYTLQLKASSTPELVGLKLVKAPATIEVTDKRDIEDVLLIAVARAQTTDGGVVVRTPDPAHYSTLRLSVALDSARHAPLLNFKLDAAGFSAHHNPGVAVPLPRVPADNRTYTVHVHSTLSTHTHVYTEPVLHYVADGNYHSFVIDFLPKIRSSEQELRQSSLLIVPLLATVAAAFLYRDALVSLAARVAAARPAARALPRADRIDRADILDKASIDQIVSSVNAAGKRTSKKKVMFT